VPAEKIASRPARWSARASRYRSTSFSFKEALSY
jgi:hypothetical protein